MKEVQALYSMVIQLCDVTKLLDKENQKSTLTSFVKVNKELIFERQLAYFHALIAVEIYCMPS